jgi:hypothetical protein
MNLRNSLTQKLVALPGNSLPETLAHTLFPGNLVIAILLKLQKQTHLYPNEWCKFEVQWRFKGLYGVKLLKVKGWNIRSEQYLQRTERGAKGQFQCGAS